MVSHNSPFSAISANSAVNGSRGVVARLVAWTAAAQYYGSIPLTPHSLRSRSTRLGGLTKIRHAVAALFVLQLAGGVSAAEAQGRRNRITEAEIEKANAADAYELVRKLRPSWFTSRGIASGNEFAGAMGWFIDGMRIASEDQLRSLIVERIKEVRYYNMGDATNRFGGGLTAGAIEFITKR